MINNEMSFDNDDMNNIPRLHGKTRQIQAHQHSPSGREKENWDITVRVSKIVDSDSGIVRHLHQNINASGHKLDGRMGNGNADTIKYDRR